MVVYRTVMCGFVLRSRTSVGFGDGEMLLACHLPALGNRSSPDGDINQRPHAYRESGVGVVESLQRLFGGRALAGLTSTREWWVEPRNQQLHQLADRPALVLTRQRKPQPATRARSPARRRPRSPHQRRQPVPPRQAKLAHGPRRPHSVREDQHSPQLRPRDRQHPTRAVPRARLRLRRRNRQPLGHAGHRVHARPKPASALPVRQYRVQGLTAPAAAHRRRLRLPAHPVRLLRQHQPGRDVARERRDRGLAGHAPGRVARHAERGGRVAE
ncbi:hypothetical protein M8818_006287 [Zalaria obscura]|uniref:Uncharacterized protein n=1 Tax=Zalaria obscura TaxID=2024903 RepID=A0ACC3SBU0_9PEZI